MLASTYMETESNISALSDLIGDVISAQAAAMIVGQNAKAIVGEYFRLSVGVYDVASVGEFEVNYSVDITPDIVKDAETIHEHHSNGQHFMLRRPASTVCRTCRVCGCDETMRYDTRDGSCFARHLITWMVMRGSGR